MPIVIKCPSCIYGELAYINSAFWGCTSCGSFVDKNSIDNIIKKKEKDKMPKINFTRDMALRNLTLRKDLFNKIPSITNMILTFEITDALILQTYKLGGLDMNKRETERSLERYEKCKNLALGNKNFNERKLAYNRTLEIFYKVINEEIKEGKENA